MEFIIKDNRRYYSFLTANDIKKFLMKETAIKKNQIFVIYKSRSHNLSIVLPNSSGTLSINIYKNFILKDVSEMEVKDMKTIIRKFLNDI